MTVILVFVEGNSDLIGGGTLAKAIGASPNLGWVEVKGLPNGWNMFVFCHDRCPLIDEWNGLPQADRPDECLAAMHKDAYAQRDQMTHALVDKNLTWDECSVFSRTADGGVWRSLCEVLHARDDNSKEEALKGLAESIRFPRDPGPFTEVKHKIIGPMAALAVDLQGLRDAPEQSRLAYAKSIKEQRGQNRDSNAVNELGALVWGEGLKKSKDKAGDDTIKPLNKLVKHDDPAQERAYEAIRKHVTAEVPSSAEGSSGGEGGTTQYSPKPELSEFVNRVLKANARQLVDLAVAEGTPDDWRGNQFLDWYFELGTLLDNVRSECSDKAK